MAGDRSDVAKPGMPGLLGTLGLSSKALLAIALLAFLIWWFFKDQGMPLNTSETAVVVLALALLWAGVGLVRGLVRRRAPVPDKPE